MREPETTGLQLALKFDYGLLSCDCALDPCNHLPPCSLINHHSPEANLFRWLTSIARARFYIWESGIIKIVLDTSLGHSWL